MPFSFAALLPSAAPRADKSLSSGKAKHAIRPQATATQAAHILGSEWQALSSSSSPTQGELAVALATTLDIGEAGDTAAVTKPYVPDRRHIGRARTSRVDILLQKYLQQQAETVAAPDVLQPPPPGSAPEASGAEGVLASAGAARMADAADAHGVQKCCEAVLGRERSAAGAAKVKTIMQVKGEQDAAIRELQHAPRKFRATPVPLAVAAPRHENLAKAAHNEKAANHRLQHVESLR